MARGARGATLSRGQPAPAFEGRSEGGARRQGPGGWGARAASPRRVRDRARRRWPGRARLRGVAHRPAARASHGQGRHALARARGARAWVPGHPRPGPDHPDGQRQATEPGRRFGEAPVRGQWPRVSENVARELLGDYSPMVARRAAIKRRMTSLLESLFRDGEFPERLPDETWAALAWLTIVGYLTPPVHMPVCRIEDGRSVSIDRWQARRMVEAEARRLGFEVGQFQASLEVARRNVLGASMERFAQALR